jgi:hypothetical protein
MVTRNIQLQAEASSRIFEAVSPKFERDSRSMGCFSASEQNPAQTFLSEFRKKARLFQPLTQGS